MVRFIDCVTVADVHIEVVAISVVIAVVVVSVPVEPGTLLSQPPHEVRQRTAGSLGAR